MEAKVGNVISFSKGYGFVMLDNGSTAFVHYKEIMSTGFKGLYPGMRVKGEYDENNGKPTLTKVRNLDDTPFMMIFAQKTAVPEPRTQKSSGRE